MSEEDKFQKFLRAYFIENKIKEDVAEKIVKQAQQFQAKNKSRQFLGRFFDALKKSYDSKNPKSFINACKRFLFVISKLLGDGRKQKSGRYPEIISSQIVQYYLFFFEIIFKHHLLELTVDLKMCRMKWVKIITDAAFIKLRQQILKKYKFNLDRGFSEENLEKIRKIHKKRGLNEKQSNFYLGIIQQHKQVNPEDVKRQDKKIGQNSESSSSEDSDAQNENGMKRVKADYVESTPMNAYQPMYPGYGAQLGYPPIGSGHYENPSPATYSDPRVYRPQNIYPFNPPTNPPSYQTNEYLRQQTQIPNLSKYPFSPPSQLPTTNLQNNSYPYQNFPRPQRPYEVPKVQSPYEFRQVAESKKSEFNINKIKKIRDQLQKNLIKCRQCGQLFENGQNHDKHMTEHFFNSLQKVNEVELRGKMKKQNKIKMFDIKSWQSIEKEQEKQYRFEVLVTDFPDQRDEQKVCFFCNEKLQMSFSSKYEEWVYCDAIKIEDQGHMGIIHFDCYESFKSDQNSPEQN